MTSVIPIVLVSVSHHSQQQSYGSSHYMLRVAVPGYASSRQSGMLASDGHTVQCKACPSAR